MSELFTGLGRALGIIPPRDSVTIETNSETGVSTRVTVRNGVTTRRRVYIDPRTRAISETPPSLEQSIRNLRAQGIDVRVEGSPAASSRGSAASSSSSRRSAASRSGADPRVELPEAETQQQPQIEIDPDLNARTTTIGRSTSQVFDINSFRSEILENDVLPSHSYLVTFAQFRAGVGKEVGPLNDFVINKRNTLMMRCENVVLPAPSLLEEENIRRYGYGAVEKIPYGVQFSDVTITWLVDKNSEIIDFMHQWMNTIVMHDSPNTLMRYGAPTRPNLDAYAPFEVGYKDAYANPIVRIYVYNRQQQTVTEYELYDVFPMNIQSMNLSWSDENQVQKLTVTFAYTNMKVNAPIKSKEQYNYYQEGRTSPYEEREQPDNKGGKAAADRQETNLLDYVTKQMNASKPIATDGQYDYYNVEIPETAAAPTPPTPTVHNLTTG